MKPFMLHEHRNRQWAWLMSHAALSAAPLALCLAPSPQAHRAVLPQLPCQVVACVPQDELAAAPWAAQEDSRRTAKFMSYALTAAAEASRLYTGCQESKTGSLACLASSHAHVSASTRPAVTCPAAGPAGRWLAARDARAAAGHRSGNRRGHELHF